MIPLYNITKEKNEKRIITLIISEDNISDKQIILDDYKGSCDVKEGVQTIKCLNACSGKWYDNDSTLDNKIPLQEGSNIAKFLPENKVQRASQKKFGNLTVNNNPFWKDKDAKEVNKFQKRYGFKQQRSSNYNCWTCKNQNYDIFNCPKDDEYFVTGRGNSNKVPLSQPVNLSNEKCLSWAYGMIRCSDLEKLIN